MKSEKGITLTSLIIYVIAMVFVVSIVTVVTKYFYGNINKLTQSTTSLGQITRLNTFISEEINKTDNTIYYCDPNGEFIVFYNPQDKDKKIANSGYIQYTFKNDSIYLNKIKICNNIKNCKFEVIEDDYKYKFKITITALDGNTMDTTYTLKTSKKVQN